MGRVTARRRASHFTPDETVTRPETLVVEEPLEIRVNGNPVSVTMRTPGYDVELAQGFLLTEGVIGRRDDVVTVRYCKGTGRRRPEHLQRAGRDARPRRRDAAGRHHPQLLHDVVVRGVRQGVPRCGAHDQPLLARRRRLDGHAETLSAMPELLRAAQKVFDSTGGLHGAALFDADGSCWPCARISAGTTPSTRSSAGPSTEQGPAAGTVLLVSGRASFELTQKAVMAGIPVMAAVSAPSSLAVDLASQSGVTLVAFLRGESMNVYTRPDRIKR